MDSLTIQPWAGAYVGQGANPATDARGGPVSTSSNSEKPRMVLKTGWRTSRSRTLSMACPPVSCGLRKGPPELTDPR